GPRGSRGARDRPRLTHPPGGVGSSAASDAPARSRVDTRREVCGERIDGRLCRPSWLLAEAVERRAHEVGERLEVVAALEHCRDLRSEERAAARKLTEAVVGD